MSETERLEILSRLGDACFKNERICALISCIQHLLTSKEVEICGIPDNTLDYALYEIELNLAENCKALRELEGSPGKQNGGKRA